MVIYQHGMLSHLKAVWNIHLLWHVHKLTLRFVMDDNATIITVSEHKRSVQSVTDSRGIDSGAALTQCVQKSITPRTSSAEHQIHGLGPPHRRMNLCALIDKEMNWFLLSKPIYSWADLAPGLFTLVVIKLYVYLFLYMWINILEDYYCVHPPKNIGRSVMNSNPHRPWLVGLVMIAHVTLC